MLVVVVVVVVILVVFVDFVVQTQSDYHFHSDADSFLFIPCTFLKQLLHNFHPGTAAMSYVFKTFSIPQQQCLMFLKLFPFRAISCLKDLVFLLDIATNGLIERYRKMMFTLLIIAKE